MTTDKLTCEWCHQPFERRAAKGPAPKYCRESHRQAAYQARKFNRPIVNLSVEPVPEGSIIVWRTDRDDQDEVDASAAELMKHLTQRVGHKRFVLAVLEDDTIEVTDLRRLLAEMEAHPSARRASPTPRGEGRPHAPDPWLPGKDGRPAGEPSP